ncbi:acyl carrier protein [Streptomyces sp. NBC_00525]|uniref:acyl carrier protein n=1 Tax=Streptomyces sp. NBC_00525 TaxID=2903660 RepID=UPI002E7FB7CE|nr:acyl carrier protein [Streptomyces sp. NBC_00525]WUC95440.1 acyl carrier protein [Streptomyces sp. NBC_00525]
MPAHPLPPLTAETTHEEVRERISAVWRDLFAEPGLRIEDDDNFFSLGASSLLAMRMVTVLSEELEVPLSMLAVVENPTLGGLVRHVRELSAAGSDREVGEL